VATIAEEATCILGWVVWTALTFLVTNGFIKPFVPRKQEIEIMLSAPAANGEAAKNTQFHKTGTSLGFVDYFPYRQALPTDRRSLGAACSAQWRMQQEMRIGEAVMKAFESKIVEAEQRREKFRRVTSGWYQANEVLQKLVQAYHVKKHEVAKLAAALEEEQRREQQPRTFELWNAVAQPDYQHLNYARERVDVRKTNYFVQDSRGHQVENVYLPDMELRSPRRNTFLSNDVPPPGAEAPAASGAQFGLWVPNPTFHNPVRKLEGHWFGAGGLPGDNQARYLEERRCERTEAPAARFLLRRRPDVLGSVSWTELDARPLMCVWPHSKLACLNKSVEAMLTARRGYVPQAQAHALPGKRQRKSLDPALLPTGSPDALDNLLSPRLEQARSTEALGSPYAIDLQEVLESPRRLSGNSPAKIGADIRHDARADNAEQPVVPYAKDAELYKKDAEVYKKDAELYKTFSAQRDIVKRNQAKKYFHAEDRGKCFSSAGAARRPDDVESVQVSTSHLSLGELSRADTHSLQPSDASGEREVADKQLERQRMLREEHARELLRRSTVDRLPDFAAVQRLPAAFVPRAAIPVPDVQLKVIIFAFTCARQCPATRGPVDDGQIFLCWPSLRVSSSLTARLTCPEHDHDCQCCVV
jgi:hypothetical protein